jgi:adenylate cyclase
MQEIERKFLVKNDAYKAQAASHKRITQGYLNAHPQRTVRVRVKGSQGFLTIKGKSNKTGTTRFEWEKEIPLKVETHL